MPQLRRCLTQNTSIGFFNSVKRDRISAVAAPSIVGSVLASYQEIHDAEKAVPPQAPAQRRSGTHASFLADVCMVDIEEENLVIIGELERFYDTRRCGDPNDPLAWWKANERDFPVIAKMALSSTPKPTTSRCRIVCYYSITPPYIPTNRGSTRKRVEYRTIIHHTTPTTRAHSRASRSALQPALGLVAQERRGAGDYRATLLLFMEVDLDPTPYLMSASFSRPTTSTDTPMLKIPQPPFTNKGAVDREIYHLHLQLGGYRRRYTRSPHAIVTGLRFRLGFDLALAEFGAREQQVLYMTWMTIGIAHKLSIISGRLYTICDDDGEVSGVSKWGSTPQFLCFHTLTDDFMCRLSSPVLAIILTPAVSSRLTRIPISLSYGTFVRPRPQDELAPRADVSSSYIILASTVSIHSIPSTVVLVRVSPHTPLISDLNTQSRCVLDYLLDPLCDAGFSDAVFDAGFTPGSYILPDSMTDDTPAIQGLFEEFQCYSRIKKGFADTVRRGDLISFYLRQPWLSLPPANAFYFPPTVPALFKRSAPLLISSLLRCLTAGSNPVAPNDFIRISAGIFEHWS
ncbi:hypothetical protein C8J57DRAFT_1533898 [Mycena rebaudengoi]|nr:hypothetical protein C8J57DRAFT_1533898 [Mycena rebaudengoi]